MADWLPEEDDILTRLWHEGKTFEAIQAALPPRVIDGVTTRRSLHAIQNHARRALDLPPRRQKCRARAPGEDRG